MNAQELQKAEEAFTFAQEAVKQMITLSTAAFALTLTFRKDIAPSGTDTTCLEVAWGAYLVSVLFGLFTLMNLAGQFARSANPSIYGGGIPVCGIVQAVSFLTALGFTLAYGISGTT